MSSLHLAGESIIPQQKNYCIDFVVQHCCVSENIVQSHVHCGSFNVWSVKVIQNLKTVSSSFVHVKYT